MWRSIRAKLVILYLLLILFFMQLIGAYFLRSLTTSLISETTDTIKGQTQLLATIAAPEMKAAHSAEDMSSVLSSFPQFLAGVVYVLNDQGVVVVTSAGNALIGQKRMDSVAAQVMVDHTTAYNIRLDPTTGQHFYTVAVPMFERDFVGVVEYVVPIQQTYDTVRNVTNIFYTGSAFALILTALFSVFLSRAIARPILEVTRQARNLADGDFSGRVQVRSNDEFGDLAHAVNELTDRLEDAIDENSRERERLRAVIKYIADGIIAFDVQFQPLFANDAVRKLLRYEDITQLADKLKINWNNVGPDFTGKEFVREVDDKLLYIHLTAIRKHHYVDGYVVLIRDVTEQEQLNQARRDFVATVSHELRTPLTSVKSYIEAIKDGSYGDEETLNRFVHVIDNQTDRMVRLTRDLLQLSGLESKEKPMRESSIDVTDWLVDMMQRFHIQARTHSIQLELRSNVSATIDGDRDLLDRLLDNLVSNALSYTPEGGSIVISSAIEKQEIVVQVEDTGIGIPRSDLPFVFERFYRVDKARSRKRGGFGLGLSLAREITEHHGGHIHIESTVNKGTTVTVRLPLSRREEGIS